MMSPHDTLATQTTSAPRRALARAIGASAIGITLGAALAVPASAQGSAGPGSSDIPSPEQLAAVGSSTLVTGSTYLGGSVRLESVLGSLDAVGSSDFARPGSSGIPSEAIAHRNPTITETEVVAVEPLFPASDDPEYSRAEVWTVTSRAMQREVRVEVYRAPEEYSAAPIVYFLDGVESPVPSGWSGGMGFGNADLRSLPVTVVAPTGGPASMWADWQADDPVLGPNKWETFLTSELPPLLENGADDLVEPVPFNADQSYGTLGISMGGGPALDLANRHQSQFRGAAAVSGCFSPTSAVGYQNIRLTAESRGGNPENLWGPPGSDLWRLHDTVADPSGLAGQRVYVSAATGRIGSSDLENFGSSPMVLADGHLLERGSYECTQALSRSLDSHGIEHRADFDSTGIHNWPVFIPRITDALEYLVADDGLGVPELAPQPRSTLLDALTGGDEGGSSGSLGSAGS